MFAAQPIAAACGAGIAAAAGQLIAVLGIRGDSIDTAVLRRTPQGFELAGQPGGQAGGDGSAASLESGVLELLATVTAAGLSPGQLAAVYVTGEAGQAARVTSLIARIMGIQPRIAPGPETVTVLGALAMTGDPVSPQRPRSRLRPAGPAGRTVPRRRRVRAWTGLAAAVAVIAGVAVTLALMQPGRPAGHGPEPAGHPDRSPLGYQLTQRRLVSNPTTPVSYQVRAQFPVVRGLANHALQQRINTALRAPVSREISDFSTEARSYPVGTSGAFLYLKDTAYQVKNILSVKYEAESHNAGAGDVSYELSSVTIQMSTGAPLGLSDILTTTALSAAWRHKLAADLQAQKGISECDGQPGWRGATGIPQVLTAINAPAALVVNVTPGGLAFSFGDDTIAPTACRPVGVVPFAELSGLLRPAIADLGPASAPSAAPGTAAASPTASPASPPASAAPPATPAAVVRAYFAAISQRDYRRAWKLGGDHLGQSYAQFAGGFAGTARDIVRVTAVRGDVVAISLTAVQSDKTRLRFSGTCTVAHGAIARSALVQVP